MIDMEGKAARTVVLVLADLNGVQVVVGSNPTTPTIDRRSRL